MARSAVRLAARGDHVVLNDIDAEAAEAARAQIEAAGGACTVVPGDISDADVVAATIDAASGRVDVLVNNVGDFRPASRDFAHSTPEQWQRLYELNLKHVFDVTHAALPLLVDGSAVVNVSTVEAYRGIPGHAVYSAFNAGVSAFTKSLAVELGPRGVRVNAIAPDLADTDQTPAEAMLRGRDPGARRALGAAGQVRPAGRLRRRGRVPDLRRGAVRHRPDHPRRRRHAGGVRLVPPRRRQGLDEHARPAMNS